MSPPGERMLQHMVTISYLSESVYFTANSTPYSSQMNFGEIFSLRDLSNTMLQENIKKTTTTMETMAICVHEQEESMEMVQKENLVEMSDELELLVLRTLIVWSRNTCCASYSTIKNVPVVHLLMNLMENAAGKTGMLYMAERLFNAFIQVGDPITAKVDKAMGERILRAFIYILQSTGHVQVERRDPNKVDSNDQLVVAMKAEHDAELDQLREHLNKQELTSAKYVEDMLLLNERIIMLEKEKDSLHQELTDVHNYRETERGKTLNEMENLLAETKIQKAIFEAENKKLQLELEKANRKKMRKGASSRSSTPRSVSFGVIPTE